MPPLPASFDKDLAQRAIDRVMRAVPLGSPLAPSSSQETGRVIGIDPGAEGGLACLESTTMRIVSVIKRPEDRGEILDWLFEMTKEGSRCIAVIEQVSGWMGGNVKEDGTSFKHGGQTGSAMFKFGLNYGELLMALTATGFVEGQSLHIVAPRKWQSRLGIEPGKGKHNKARQQHKRDLKDVAQSLFPQEQVTLWKADALLIAEYARRHYA